MCSIYRGTRIAMHTYTLVQEPAVKKTATCCMYHVPMCLCQTTGVKVRNTWGTEDGNLALGSGQSGWEVRFVIKVWSAD